MNLTSQIHTKNRREEIRAENARGDRNTEIGCSSKELDSCAPRLNTQEINTKKLNRLFNFKQIARRACRRSLNAFLGLFFFVVTRIPYFHFLKGTQGSQNPCLFRYWFWQKFLGLNRTAYWPVHFTSKINQSKNISVGIDSAPGYEPGCYIQGLGPVRIGNYTQVAANVGIISANHDFTDLRLHSEKPGVTIGSYCWIGMNSVILPGVVLGDFTIVGANTVVTKSFEEGHCVIVGSPAKVVRKLHPDDCVSHDLESPYHGYVRHEDFADFRKRRLSA